MDVLYRQLFASKGRKVLAVAKNYFKHAIEMKATDVPPKPVVFQKPLTSIIDETSQIVIPGDLTVHYELELGVMIGKEAKNAQKQDAMDYVAGYFLALDLTARDVQSEAKSNGWPWDVGKGYDTFLPLSKFLDKALIPDPYSLEMELLINGKTKQKGSPGDMHYKIDHLISYLSHIFTLCPGDLLLTGTPEGIGPIAKGDHLDCYLRKGSQELLTATFKVSPS